MSKGNEEALHIPRSSWTGASPSDILVSYPGHLLGESYPSAAKLSAYFTTQANSATNLWAIHIYVYLYIYCTLIKEDKFYFSSS